jgi:dihydrofolate reductase
MPKLRVHNFSISLEGYGAGPAQRLDEPLGEGGRGLHEWVFETRGGRKMIGLDGGETGPSDDYFTQGEPIMGRNMFGPIRGPWGDEEWKGWWGDNPPYHHPAFVLTHHPRPSITMEGGTTFHFVDDSIEAVLQRAFDAADGRDVRLGGGVATIQQYLRAGLIDELHFSITPALLRGGERLFDNLNGGPDGYECVEFVPTTSVAHVRLARTAPRR